MFRIIAALALALAATAAAAEEPNPYARYAQPQCAAGFKPVGKSCFKVCPDGQHAPAANLDRCEKDVPQFVKRGFFGGCPTGYVGHPADPRQCTLPIIAERMLRPRR
ncbi:TPA: hypothetical protein UN285_000433 [Stenotrophomonas maltophilia]|uniref:hypothetical protein n=1 Tax=Stenotrophomonas maltophilia TaxID=40324 RepID=UPI000C14AA46|nr:hypothetical protein [Stenotrophomonas maltophilia]EKU9979186.1 hypothetical protein [Stenotrophomonas maltophilia]EKX6271056.1 hypothetical protein [Stenotrophomonas maltophilia]MBS6054049.1 hypothetical protein [Stenotrophomonas maltophilia]MDG9766176.1 hypothetical protein [Stenotrophomonas maltophilia]MDG9908440.1 hypothetical protein [Stenotrophomonas maltophilia]